MKLPKTNCGLEPSVLVGIWGSEMIQCWSDNTRKSADKNKALLLCVVYIQPINLLVKACVYYQRIWAFGVWVFLNGFSLWLQDLCRKRLSLQLTETTQRTCLPPGSVDLHCLMPKSKVLISCHKTDREDSVLAIHFLFCSILFQPLKNIMAYLRNEKWNWILTLKRPS